jgi:hypothetical protein
MDELIAKIEEGRKESVRLRKALETESAALKKAEERFGRAKEDLEAAFAKAKDPSKHQRAYDEAKSKLDMQTMKVSGIESEIERIENELIELDLLRRRTEIEGCVARIREKQKILQEIQSKGGPLVIEIAAEWETIENNIVIRRERIRVDPVRCLILDPKMKRIQANKKVAYVGTVQKEDPKLPYHVETFVEEGGEVYGHIGYEIAARLQKEGKVKIVEEGRAKYDIRIVEDPRPAILDDLKSLDLGKPVTIDGKTTPFFDDVRKAIGYDPDITPDTMFQMLFEKKYADMRRIG